MTERINIETGCSLIGEFVDEATDSTDSRPQRSEVIGTHDMGVFIDLWGTDDSIKDFTVLLKDGPHPAAGQDVYSIVVRTTGEDVLVALFKSGEVAGIFHGQLLTDRKIA